MNGTLKPNLVSTLVYIYTSPCYLELYAAICAALCTQLQVTKRFVSQNNIRRLVYDMVDGVDQDTTMRMESNQSDDGHFGMSS